MATLAEFSNISSKRVMGFEDFGTRMLGYLQGLCRGTISHAYVNGSFFEAMGLSSPGADQVQMDLKTGGAGDVHDGLGNILDLSLVTRSAVFENSNGVDYEVGAGYVAKPSGIQINPTYGFPEYVKYIEDVGEEAEPDAVTDNGGTITFRVDSVTQNGEDNSGRTVRVFKKVPADGALTPAIAIEECTVAYGGGENTITTAGTLGQTTVSTTASDYFVQLVGISVRRAAGNPISTSGVHFFAGVVTGNAGTPTVFDISGQNILEATSADQVSFQPYTGPAPLSWAIAATDVQSAIEEIVDDLSSDGGDQLVDVSNSNFNWLYTITNSDSGGFLNTGIDNLKEFTQAVENRVLRRRVGTATISDGTSRTICDFTGSTAAQQIQTLNNGGLFWIQRGTSNLTFYPGQYTIGGASSLPKLIGEVNTGGHDGYQNIVLNNGGTNDLYLRGHFERLHFYSGDYNNYIQLRFGGTSQYTTYEDCGFDSGHIRYSGNDSEERPLVMKNCEVSPGSGAGPGVASLECQRISTGLWPHFIAEGCVFRGPHSSATSQWGVLYIDDFGDEVTQYTQLKTKGGFVFKDCLFIHDNFNAMPTVWIGSSYPEEVTFENCIFIGKAGQTEPVVYASGARVNMKNCKVYAPSGQAMLMEDCEGVLEDVYILSGTDTTVTDPQLFACCGRYTNDMVRPLHIRNMRIRANAGCIRNGTTPTMPMVEIGGSADDYDGGPVHVDGLHIQIPYNTGMHDYSTLVLRNVENASKTYPEGVRGYNTFKNISIDCGYSADTPGSNLQNHIVRFENDNSRAPNAVVENFSMTNIAKPTGSNTSYSVLYSYQFDAKHVHLGFNSGGAGTSYSFDSAIYMQRGTFQHIKIVSRNTYDDQLIVSHSIIKVGYKGKIIDVDLGDASGVYFSSATANIYMGAQHGACIRVKFPTGSDYEDSIPGIYVVGSQAHIMDNEWDNWTVAPGEPFIMGRATDGQLVVTGNIIDARSGGDDYIDLGTTTDCPASIMMCNVMHSTISGNPTFVNGSTDSVGGAGENVISDA